MENGSDIDWAREEGGVSVMVVDGVVGMIWWLRWESESESAGTEWKWLVEEGLRCFEQGTNDCLTASNSNFIVRSFGSEG